MTTENSPSYDRAGFARLAAAENRHFWFRERNRLICWALHKYFPAMTSFCDVGCGTGMVLQSIESQFPELVITGIDYFPDGLAFARDRLRRTELRSGNILDLPAGSPWDVIGTFDVLEHIPDDRAALAGIYQALPPGGGLILTVPQHPWLWSVADEMGFHQRRYRRHDLIQKVAAAGFQVRRITSFVSLLLPILWLSRRQASSEADALAELKIGPILNGLCAGLLKFERGLIHTGLSLPMGSSLLLVATRI